MSKDGTPNSLDKKKLLVNLEAIISRIRSLPFLEQPNWALIGYPKSRLQDFVGLMAFAVVHSSVTWQFSFIII